MKKMRRLSLVLLTLLVALIIVPVAYAHPLRISLSTTRGDTGQPTRDRGRYVMDMAEIGFQELATIDMNRNGKTETNEAVDYRSGQCEQIRKNLSLKISSQQSRLECDSSWRFLQGRGIADAAIELHLYRIYRRVAEHRRCLSVDFANQNYPIAWAGVRSS
jgi:hypothetical protein